MTTQLYRRQCEGRAQCAACISWTLGSRDPPTLGSTGGGKAHSPTYTFFFLYPSTHVPPEQWRWDIYSVCNSWLKSPHDLKVGYIWTLGLAICVTFRKAQFRFCSSCICEFWVWGSRQVQGKALQKTSAVSSFASPQVREEGAVDTETGLAEGVTNINSC